MCNIPPKGYRKVKYFKHRFYLEILYYLDALLLVSNWLNHEDNPNSHYFTITLQNNNTLTNETTNNLS
jgi:hypothetical protein